LLGFSHFERAVTTRSASNHVSRRIWMRFFFPWNRRMRQSASNNGLQNNRCSSPFFRQRQMTQYKQPWQQTELWGLSFLETVARDTLQATVGAEEQSRFSFRVPEAGDAVQTTMAADWTLRFIFPRNSGTRHLASNHWRGRTVKVFLPFTRGRRYSTYNHGSRQT